MRVQTRTSSHVRVLAITNGEEHDTAALREIIIQKKSLQNLHYIFIPDCTGLEDNTVLALTISRHHYNLNSVSHQFKHFPFVIRSQVASFCLV